MPIGLNYEILRNNRVALSHNWALEMDCSTLNKPMRTLASSFKSGAGKAGDWISIACVSSTLPHSTVKIVSKKIRGIPVHQAAGRDGLQGTITLTAQEYSDYRLHKFFEAWMQAEVGRFTLAQDAWARIPDSVFLNLYDSTRTKITARYQMFETYCTDSNIGQLGSDGQLVQVNFTLAYMGYRLLTEGEVAGGIEQKYLEEENLLGVMSYGA